MKLTWETGLTDQLHDPLFRLYRNEWWTKGRSKEDVVKAFEHSDLVVFCLNEDQQLLACARVLSDFTFKAMIFDVIVADMARGEGVGLLLIDFIISHEKLAKVRNFELYCPDHVATFYQKLGFEKSSSALYRFKNKTR